MKIKTFLFQIAAIPKWQNMMRFFMPIFSHAALHLVVILPIAKCYMQGQGMTALFHSAVGSTAYKTKCSALKLGGNSYCTGE